MIYLHSDLQASIEQAVALLNAGEVVAIPTETVYGLAADIFQPQAIEKIYHLKQRPLYHPLIVHIGSQRDLMTYAVEIPSYVFTLAEKFWPGPLTFVVRKSALINPMLTGGQDSVALRMPAHPITLQLIKALGHPLAAPSANRYGHVSPTTPQHVIDEFGTQVPLILDGGRCDIGIESTILDARHPHQCTILRQGMLTASQLNTELNQENFIQSNPNITATTLRVSGNLASHYAPNHPLVIYQNISELQALCDQYSAKRVYILPYASASHLNLGNEWIMPCDPKRYAYQLYFQLRIADKMNIDVIAVQAPPHTEMWLAIHDKLARAATKR